MKIPQNAAPAPKVDRTAAMRAGKLAKAARDREALKAELKEEMAHERIAELHAAPPTTRGHRSSTRETQPRESIHEPVRSGAVVQGRDGEVLTRKRRATGDMFEIPIHLVPKGYTYQWNLFTALEKEITDQQLIMAENGWRPVPASRHPGLFMPAGHTGSIIRGGLRLEERPESLTIEAKEEEEDKARGQISDRNASLRLAGKQALPDGFSDRHRGARPRVAMSIDRGVDIPRPQHELADGSE